MMFRLVILSGPLQGQQISVGPQPMTLGRDPACELAIPDAELASRHALLEQRGEALVVRDLGTMNRLLVNRREVREARLKHGDLVEIGRSRLLVQALVQAELDRAPGTSARPGRRVAWALVLTLGLLLALWAGLKLRNAAQATRPPAAEPVHQPPPLPAAAETAAPSNPPATNLPAMSPVAEDVRRMRVELNLIREALRQLAAYTQAPPTSVTTQSLRIVPSESPPVPTNQPPRATPAAQPSLRLIALEQQRLPDRPEFDEMRLVHITLAPTADPPPAADAIRVRVTFYDRDDNTGAIAPTSALTLPAELVPPSDWNRREPITLTASCCVPHGLRDREAQAGRIMRFLGYHVQVYAHDRLQAEDARPPNLLSPELPSGGKDGNIPGL